MHNQFLLPINFKLYIIVIKKSNINVYVFVLIFILFMKDATFTTFLQHFLQQITGG